MRNQVINKKYGITIATIDQEDNKLYRVWSIQTGLNVTSWITEKQAMAFMNKKQTKGEKVIGIATIIDFGSFGQGACSLETPFIVIKVNNQEYMWQSGQVEYYDLHGRIGKTFHIDAFKRQDSDRLYKVKVS